MPDIIIDNCYVCGVAEHEARGLCHRCYQRLRVQGNLPPKQPSPTPLERFLSKIDFTAGCWEWVAYKNEDGYGTFKATGMVKAYRFSYEWFVGPIPTGLEIDHTCRNRGCVNPDHLEAVTHRENVQRSPAFGTETHCLHGHERTEKNTYWYHSSTRPNPWKVCRDCDRESQKRLRDKKKAVAWT